MTVPRTTKRRPILPVALILAGLVGLGLAAASELDMAWNGSFQAGAVEVTADCQDEGAQIGVSFADLEFDPTATQIDATNVGPVPWSVASIEFTNISAACHSLSYEAAYLVDEATGWKQLGPAATVGEAGVTVDVPEGVDPQTISRIALTIHGDS